MDEPQKISMARVGGGSAIANPRGSRPRHEFVQHSAQLCKSAACENDTHTRTLQGVC